ncbi:hypothetical protein [Zhenhengia yiwuensis]|uniref:hypothetical protein n=1 Tax=Zhenhengia yiwuensis TaxID=2763666 RepID=UPI002A748486|nr:hypothetical protein [Zhenhengia yiwuensis]MDY3368718.1 hypothetical protein [Zhenhengia yiwuensis]
MKASRLVAGLLVGMMMISTIGCSKGSESVGSGGDSQEAGTTSQAGSDVEIDPNKTYDISYYGWWCEEYKPGNHVEQLISDALNINIEVPKLGNDEAINLALASGDMPDCGWFGKSPEYMHDQELVRTIPVEMVKKYAPNFIKIYEENPVLYASTLNAEDNTQFDYLTGITLQFVDYYLPNDYYRYDWILDLGIDLGVNVEQISDNIYVADDGITVDKFKEIMEKFVHNDPDGNGKADTVGVNAPSLTQGPFFSAFGFRGGVNNVDGKAVQWYATPGYKEYLKFFAQMYAEGLVDPEIIAENRNISWERVNKNEAGYWITSTNSLNSWAVERPPLSLIRNNPDVKILMTPGIKPEGGEVQASVASSPGYGNFYVNANVDDEKLAKILQFVDYCLFGETRASHFFGEEGVDWKWDGDMPVKINQLPSGEKGTWSFSQHGQDAEVTKWTSYEPMFEAGLKYWAKEANGSWMKFQHPNYKEDIRRETNYAELNAEYSGEISAYISTYRTECILGKKDVDATWDAYLAELDRLGYNEIMAELDKLDPLEDIIAEYSTK